MKRALCGLLLGAAALTTTPASAVEGVRIAPSVYTDPNGRVGAGFSYSTDGGKNYEPGGAAYVTPSTPDACVGFSFQIPQCASDHYPGPIN